MGGEDGGWTQDRERSGDRTEGRGGDRTGAGEAMSASGGGGGHLL